LPRFRIGVEVANIITCDKSFGSWLIGSNLWEGVENLWFPLTEPVAVNTSTVLLLPVAVAVNTVHSQ